VPSTTGVRGNEITVRVGDIGTITRIKATVIRRADRPVVKTITINPATINILISPDTYTPYWYAGAPEVTAGSTVTLTALPIMRTTTGRSIATDEIDFIWRSGGEVLTHSLGENSIVFTALSSGLPREISVQATAGDGEAVAIEKIIITPVSPEIFFYQEHPTLDTRRGTNIEAIPFTDQEITIRAEPYFFSHGDILDVIWSVDGVGVSSSERDGRLLTVRRASDRAAQVIVDLVVENTIKIAQRVRSSFVLLFGQRTFGF